MIQFSFTINADAGRFETWLVSYVRENYAWVIWPPNVGRDYVTVQANILTFTKYEKKHLAIMGLRTHERDDEFTDLYPPINLIVFQILSPAAQRTVVDLEFNPIAGKVLALILLEIARLWPESIDGIRDFLTQIDLIPKPNQNAEKKEYGLLKRVKPGPKTYDDKEKIDAVRAWVKSRGRITIEDFLEGRFGSDVNGNLKVKKSTFYAWWKDLRDRRQISD
ncbi:MAG: hypothetical protein WEA61_03320 [Anaerolineales bacterium]